MIAQRIMAMGAIALLVSSCSDAEEPSAIQDPSKLSAELEAEAQDIEKRAAVAVEEAEALAERELRALRAEAARSAESTDETAVPRDKTGN